jgi:hypothetical protein
VELPLPGSKRIARALIGVTLCCFPAAAETSALAQKPEVSGPLQVLDVWLQASVASRQEPGLSIGIVYGQDLIWSKGYGFADVGKRIPASSSTLYRIASISKVFTAMAILQILFNHRLTAGLQAMGSYVWPHFIDTGSLDTFTLPYPAIEPISAERGASDFDIRNSLQIGVNYSVPHPRTNRFGDVLLGHWGTDFIFLARSAPPVNVIDGNAYFSTLYPNSKVNARPDLAGGPIYLYGGQCTAAYGSPCPGGWALNPDSKASLAAGVPAAFLCQLASAPLLAFA